MTKFLKTPGHSESTRSTQSPYLFSLAAGDVSDVADVSGSHVMKPDDSSDTNGARRSATSSRFLSIWTRGTHYFPTRSSWRCPRQPSGDQAEAPRSATDKPRSAHWTCPLNASQGRQRPGLIVDGQQRWHALSRAKNRQLAVPVAGFVTDDVGALQRDPFLRVNTVQPLPIGLVTELLPEVPTAPSPRLSARQLPAALVEMLNRDDESPFCGLIRRTSSRQGVTPQGRRHRHRPRISDRGIPEPAVRLPLSLSQRLIRYHRHRIHPPRPVGVLDRCRRSVSVGVGPAPN